MTFNEIVNNVSVAVNVTSDEGLARIGTSINTRYRRLTSTLGLLSSRRSIQTVAMTLSTRRVTVPDVEKVITVTDITTDPTYPRPLEEITYDEMLEAVPNVDRPSCYAIESISAHATVLLTDCAPAGAFSLSVEGEARATTLSGNLEPVFNESFHDILEFGAKADELRKKEKVALARDAENDFDRRLSELRLHLAVASHKDIVQNSRNRSPRRHRGDTSTSIYD